MGRIVTFGEIMLRLAAPGQARFHQAMPGRLDATFAGAEASIAASLAWLGLGTSFASALPDNPIAEACLMNLRAIGVDTQHVLRTQAGRLGVYYLEHGSGHRGAQVVYDRSGSAVAITPAQAYDWDAILAGCDCFVISGITPALSANAAEVTLHAVRCASACGIPVVCDMNYRAKLWLWQPPLTARELATQTMRGILPYVSLFVGGISDATAVLGLDDDTSPDICASALAAAFPQLTRIAFTLRAGSTANEQCFSGALWEAATGVLHRAPLHRITQVVDRLGAGDAFTAALLFALRTPELSAADQAIAFATAAGCLAHSIEGDYHFCSRAEIEAVMRGEATGRVSR
jgi:2-dehydro-3-deoxygluconokinase